MAKRILFVDDEPLVLQGLQRGLRPMRKEWEMEFATGGAAALAAMEQSAFDVIVTDMLMPGMDGAELLQQVKERFPRTARFVLSGEASRSSVLRTVAPTHQYISKPCDIGELKQKLTRALRLRNLLHNPVVQATVSQLPSIPSLPSLYVEISQEIQKPEGSLAKVAQLVSRDMGLCAKILQLVNSAFFGIPRQVSDPLQAVSLIGLENIRALALSIDVFSQLVPGTAKDLGWLWEHSFQTGAFAKAIAIRQQADTQTADDAFVAGLLHDVGELILASALSRPPGKMRPVAFVNDPLWNRKAWAVRMPKLGRISSVSGASPTRS